MGRNIVKLGGANNGVYVDYKDTGNWSAQVKNSRSAGIGTDHYWFNGRDGSVNDQITAIIGGANGVTIGATESLWWDVEDEGSMSHWTPAEVVTYATALAEAGIPIERQGVYLSSSVTRSVDWTPVVELGLRLWVADYGQNNGQVSSLPLVGSWTDVALFQYTSVGKLPGYTGNLDLSVAGDIVWTVSELQAGLNTVMNAGLTPDNNYGRATTQAVRNFQEKFGLVVDGDAGSKTLSKLATELSKA